MIEGAFIDDNINATKYFLTIQLQQQQPQQQHPQLFDHRDSAQNAISKNGTETEDATQTSSIGFALDGGHVVRLPIVADVNAIDIASQTKRKFVLNVDADMYETAGYNAAQLALKMRTNLPVSFAIELAYDSTPIDRSVGVIYAAIVLFGLYVMIIWEIVHRTFAAMVASTMSIALLAMMNERPTMVQLMSWIDVETLLLLFGMMILVAILSETGLFDYLAVYAYKVSAACCGERLPD